MKQFDDLNDMAEGVLAVPAPENADRDEINTKTARSISMTHQHLTEEEVQKIQEALKKAYCNVPDWMLNTTKSEDLGFPVNWFIEKDNKLLLENAPYWIEKLLQDRKALQEEVEYWKQAAETQKDNNVSILQQNNELQHRIAVLDRAMDQSAKDLIHASDEVSSLSQQLKEAKEEGSTLIEFATKVIGPALDGYSMCGGDVQDLAVSLGLLKEEAYDPDKHGEDHLSVFEPGDPFYVFTDILLPHRKG